MKLATCLMMLVVIGALGSCGDNTRTSTSGAQTAPVEPALVEIDQPRVLWEVKLEG